MEIDIVTALSVRSVSRSFGGLRAVNDVSFDVKESSNQKIHHSPNEIRGNFWNRHNPALNCAWKRRCVHGDVSKAKIDAYDDA